jgi:disease resistance protein RPS2
MKEIIGGTRSDEEGDIGEENGSNNTEFKLLEFVDLLLFELPELKSICSAKLLICHSLTIWIRNCEKLKRMPICFPLLENGQPSPLPSRKYIYL